TEAAQALNISSPRMSNLFKGYLEKFSIDALIEMLVRIGYKLDVDFNPDNRQQPLTMNVKKATL
ncbi:PtxR, partial [Pseudomonas syringae pv. pisi]